MNGALNRILCEKLHVFVSKTARFCVDFWNVFGRFLEGCWKGSYANFQLFLGLFDALKKRVIFDS